MTWSKEAAALDPATQIRWELVPYMVGRCLHLGCGKWKVFPHFIGVDDNDMRPEFHHSDLGWEKPEDLSFLGSQQFDLVFSCHVLHQCEDWEAHLKECWRLVKPEGYMILYAPHKDLSPKSGEPEALTNHRQDLDGTEVAKTMDFMGACDLLVNEVRDQEHEFSFFQVYRKMGRRMAFLQSWKKPKPEKTCGIVRYGAFGDMIQMSSILPWLKEQGYHITVYYSGNTVCDHDPHINRFVTQPKDIIPPRFLKEFWDYERLKYDKWINLSASVEETLLARHDRPAADWPQEARRIHMDRNYLEWTHVLAEVPPPYRQRFYATLDEKAWARRIRARLGRTILWSLAGSSIHKTWPWLDTVIQTILHDLPDVHVILVGDELCKLLQGGWDGYRNEKDVFVEKQMHPRVHCKSAKWTIRQSMAFCEVADLIIGTETGLLNCAGMLDTPKIVTLSHSSEEMLTKHWRNVTVLKPPGLDCHPCRLMHEDWSRCRKHEATGTAMCQALITPKMMWEAIRLVLGAQARRVA